MGQAGEPASESSIPEPPCVPVCRAGTLAPAGATRARRATSGTFKSGEETLAQTKDSFSERSRLAIGGDGSRRISRCSHTFPQGHLMRKEIAR
jgi:hypothetical protein